MTVQEWLENDNYFYHVTQKSNIPSILEKGLLKGRDNPFGICAIRNKEELILEYLCQMMLYTTDETIFSIIKISPKKHNLQISEITNDNVVEITNPLHNYIKRNKLVIDKDDVIEEYQINSKGICDIKAFEEELTKLGIIESLKR